MWGFSLSFFFGKNVFVLDSASLPSNCKEVFAVTSQSFIFVFNALDFKKTAEKLGS